MNRKLIFTLVFVFSLLGIQIASFKDWFFLFLLIQVIWISLTSNAIIELVNSKTTFIGIIESFNRIVIYLLVADVIIIALSTSFGFRILFAYFYVPLFYISLGCMVASVVANYYIIFDYLIKKSDSLGERLLLLFSSLFYPLGVYLINPGSSKPITKYK